MSKWFDSFNSLHILNLTIVNQVNIERFDDKETACRLLLNTLARYFFIFSKGDKKCRPMAKVAEHNIKPKA